MNNTPETDDQPVINAINDNGYQVPCVDIEYARKLERERDEAMELLESEKNTRNHIIKRSVEVERERDEAIRLLKLCADYSLTTHQRQVEEFLKKIK